MSNPVVFFDVKAGSKDLGRIEMTVSRRLDCVERTVNVLVPRVITVYMVTHAAKQAKEGL